MTFTMLMPEFFAGEPGALCECFKLCPHDARMHAAVERPLSKAAVGPGNDILAPDELGVADDAFAHELRVLDHIGGMADDTRHQDLARRQFDVLPDAPFVLMAWI